MWVGLAVLAVLAQPTQELVVPTPCVSRHRHWGAALGRTDVGLSSSAGASAAGVGGGGQEIQRQRRGPLTLLRSSAGGAAGPGGKASGKSRRRSDGRISGAASKEESDLSEKVAAAVYEGGGFKKPTKGGEGKKIPGGTLAALCLVPPDGTRQKIEKIRGQLNKNGPRWAPQVPLLFFFLRPEQVHTRGLAEASEMIRIAMKDFAPFNITMDDMSLQLHRNEWATWVFPTNATKIRSLHAALSELFPRYGDIVPTGGDYMPHISLGQWSSRSEAMDAKAKARPTFEPLTWEVNEVAIMTSPGSGTPFSVWRNFSLQGPEKLDWEGLMPIKKMHWDLYEERKELLGIMRQIVKLQTGFERQERQNMAQLNKLMNFSTEAVAPLQINEASSGAKSAAGGGGKGLGDGVGAVGVGVDEAKSRGDIAVGGMSRGGISEVGGDKEDVEIDISSEGGDEDEEDEEAEDEGDEMLLQEGDDEGLLLQANGAKPLAREDGASSTMDKESEKFLELTRKVLEDLQATSIWGEEGIVTGTIDLEDLASPPPPISISEKTDGASSGAGAGEKKSSGQQQGQQQGKQPQGQERPGEARGKAKSGGRAGKSRSKRHERESADAKDLTNILLVRHGQSTWNAEGRWQGQADMPLSGMGVAQAALAAVRLGSVVLVAGSGPFPKYAIHQPPHLYPFFSMHVRRHWTKFSPTHVWLHFGLWKYRAQNQ